MQVFLEAIKFNHDPDSATNDAFNIRRNETQTITPPEWRRGISITPEDSPAAYARDATVGQTVTIQAKFCCTDPTIDSITVRAVDGHLSPSVLRPISLIEGCVFSVLRRLLRRFLPVNTLGEVKTRDVALNKGQTDFVSFELGKVRITESGVSVSDTIWRWQYRTKKTGWIGFADTSHRIYTVLHSPKDPWQPEVANSSNTQWPWAEVLEFACHWAAGSTHADDACSRITQSVYDLGPDCLEYDRTKPASSHYTVKYPHRFDCTAFLNLLKGQPQINGPYVNCTDVATIVSSFANILGGDVSQAAMDSPNPFFDLNHHQKIGSVDSPAKDSFTFHAVAWKGDCTETDEVFDGCLKLDGDDEPKTTPFVPLLPVNLRFGRLREKAYRFRLAKDEQECQPSRGSKIRRRIGLRTGPVPMELHGVRREAAKRLYAFDTWPKPDPTEKTIISGFRLENTAINNWTLDRVKYIENEGLPASLQAFLTGEKSGDVAARIDVIESLTVSDARLILLDELAEFQRPGMTLKPDAEYGDLAFTDDQAFTIAFVRGNLVFLLRNIAHLLTDLSGVAQFIDNILTEQYLSKEKRAND